MRIHLTVHYAYNILLFMPRQLCISRNHMYALNGNPTASSQAKPEPEGLRPSLRTRHQADAELLVQFATYILLFCYSIVYTYIDQNY